MQDRTEAVTAPLVKQVEGTHGLDPHGGRRVRNPGLGGNFVQDSHTWWNACPDPSKELRHVLELQLPPRSPAKVQEVPPQLQCTRIGLDGVRRMARLPQMFQVELYIGDREKIVSQHRPCCFVVLYLNPLNSGHWTAPRSDFSISTLDYEGQLTGT